MITVDFQTMIILNGWRSMGLHFERLCLLLLTTLDTMNNVGDVWLGHRAMRFSCLRDRPMTILWAVPFI